MNLLVTGGCGYKGSVLIPLLLADGHNVTSIDTQWFGNSLPEHPQLRNLKLDVRDTDASVSRTSSFRFLSWGCSGNELPNHCVSMLVTL